MDQLSTGQKAFNSMRSEVDQMVINAQSDGFIDGYVQVYIDDQIDAYQLIDGLNYWDIDINERILNNPDFVWLDDDQRSEIIEAMK